MLCANGLNEIKPCMCIIVNPSVWQMTSPRLINIKTHSSVAGFVSHSICLLHLSQPLWSRPSHTCCCMSSAQPYDEDIFKADLILSLLWLLTVIASWLLGGAQFSVLTVPWERTCWPVPGITVLSLPVTQAWGQEVSFTLTHLSMSLKHGWETSDWRLCYLAFWNKS